MNQSTCTWAGCANPARHELGSRDGSKWANLCDEHNAEMDAAVNSPQVGDIVRAWIKAKGGAEKAAARCVESMVADGYLQRLAERWERHGALDRGHRRG